MSYLLVRQIIQAFTLSLLATVAIAQQPAPRDRPTAESPKGNVTGTVVGDRGEPLIGASVVVRRLNVIGVSPRQLITNNEGAFEARNLDEGLYSVTVNVPAYVMPARNLDTPAPPYRIGDSVRLELIRGGVITGTVTNANSDPVISVRIRALMVRDANGQDMKGTVPVMGQTATDDRGIYRIFGLSPGTYIVEVGGYSNATTAITPYDLDRSTYAPSSTRDNATEVIVTSGQESSVDVRYRAEPGHKVSGTVKDLGTFGSSISLSPVDGGWIASTNTFMRPNDRGFAFYGVGDGVYDVIAQQSLAVPGSAPDLAFSDARRITVKGADITGLELVTKPLASISGTVALQPSSAPECAGKRKPSLAETMVSIQRNRNNNADSVPIMLQRTAGFGAPDKNGSIEFKNLVAGQHAVVPRFFARYWYLQSITLTTLAAASAKSALSNQKIDVARNWITLKSGDRLSGLMITLAEGAGSVRGRLAVTDGASVPPNLNVFLVPAEREKAEDALRYFSVDVSPDRTFSADNLPPGRYWLVVQPRIPRDKPGSNVRLPDAAEVRTKLRMAAESSKNEIELKPCQNVSDYQLSLKP